MLSCRSVSDEPWSFGATRALLSSDSSQWGLERTGSEESDVGAALIVALPFVVDLVLLPVTLPHDLFFLE